MRQTPKKRSKKWLIIAAVLLGAGFIFWTLHTDTATAPTATKKQSATPAKPASFDKATYSTTDPSSVWVIINKQHPVTPQTFTPADLRQPKVSQRLPGAIEMQLRDEAATALESMFAAAKTDGLDLQITTAYRGYSYQKTLYEGYVAKQGQAAADEQSARPGFSEHQTGLAADVRPASGNCYLEACFGDTPEGQWVAANAYKYGFIVRYPEDKESVTGYKYEPWHIRYIGSDLSGEMHKQQIETLEEFFNISGGTTYLSE